MPRHPPLERQNRGPPSPTISRTWSPCPLCGSEESRPVYEAEQFAGQVLGHLHTTLVMCESCDFVYNNPRPRPRPQDLDLFYASDLDASGQVFQLAHDGGATDHVRRAQLAFMAAWNPLAKRWRWPNPMGSASITAR